MWTVVADTNKGFVIILLSPNITRMRYNSSLRLASSASSASFVTTKPSFLHPRRLLQEAGTRKRKLGGRGN